MWHIRHNITNEPGYADKKLGLICAKFRIVCKSVLKNSIFDEI